jgi:quinol monooxygenase YgiN
MSNVIVYVDTSEVREGALEQLKMAMKELVEFIESSEPRLIAYDVFLNDDETQVTVLHIHPDSASLEFHMQVAGPRFQKFVELVRLLSIDIYGTPSNDVLAKAQEKARLLGRGSVTAHNLHAGFARLVTDA